jgi:hypothetical protein
MNSMLEKLRNWHEFQLAGFQDAMRLDDYHMLWLSFGKGVLFTIVFLWII